MRTPGAAWLLVIASACSANPSTEPNTSSGVIGARGGTVSLGDEVTVGVPPGAVTADQTVTITRTDEAAPAGYVAYSPVYRFEPRGIVFAAPITVTIAFEGDASRAEMIWTTTGETGWESLGGTVATSRVSAQVSHFSGGFVGAEDADSGSVLDGGSDLDADFALDGGTADTGTVDSAVDDSGSDVDAGSDAGPAYCPVPTSISSGMTTTGLSWESTDPATSDPCLSGCTEDFGSPSRAAALVTISAPMQATLWYSHTLSPSASWNGTISGDCRAAGAACVTSTPASYGHMLTTLLDPGTYQFAACNRNPGVIIEPPPPPPTNTTCAAAGLVSPSYLQRRITTSETLYYAVDWGGTGSASIGVQSAMNQGQMHLSLRDSCTNQVAAYDVPYVLGGTTGTVAFPMAGRPAGRYYVVATAVSLGLEFEVRMIP